MMELGEASEAEHLLLLSRLKELYENQIILVGKAFCKFTIPAEFTLYPDALSMVQWLESHPVRNATILLKGSRAVGLEKLLPFL
jgi:UDP-N-acetylmuramoyl-tripeptide--D-alanyl-D-alanine ligase